MQNYNLQKVDFLNTYSILIKKRFSAYQGSAG